jgi:hypothetical protein
LEENAGEFLYAYSDFLLDSLGDVYLSLRSWRNEFFYSWE